MEYEQWSESISGAGIFMVSSVGRIRSMDRMVNCPLNGSRRVRGRILTPSPAKNGYLVVESRNGGKRRTFYVHRLVAEVFCENPDGRPHVNHRDGNKTNNAPGNLEWCTHRENMRHAAESGLTRRTPVVASSGSGFGYWFPNLNSVALAGFQPSCVSCVINGKRAVHQGFTWAIGRGLLPRPEDSTYSEWQRAAA